MGDSCALAVVARSPTPCRDPRRDGARPVAKAVRSLKDSNLNALGFSPAVRVNHLVGAWRAEGLAA